MKELNLIPPSDPRVQTAIAPFTDDMLKEHDFKDRKELTESMFECMKKFHGIGLTANQVGLPLQMFVIEGEPAYAVFNPRITYFGEEQILLEEGCLSYPGMSLKITRPRFMRARFQDPYGDYVTRQFDGITSRVFLDPLSYSAVTPS